MASLAERNSVLQQAFRLYDTEMKGELNAIQLQQLHASIRQDGISLAQTKAAMKFTCTCDDSCDSDELFTVLQEMDRRYFLVQDFRWEFELLDRDQRDTISKENARFLFECVHGELFSKRKWEAFLKSRPVPSTGIAFAEIEVELCNIPSREEIALEQYEEEKEKEDKENWYQEKKMAEAEAKERDRKMMEEEQKIAKEMQDKDKKVQLARKKEEEERSRREKEEKERLRKEKEAEDLARKEAEGEEERRRLQAEEEERKRREIEIIEVQQALEKEKELQRQAKELEEQEAKEKEEAKSVEEEAERAAQAEQEAEEEARKAREAVKNAKDAESRREAEEAEKKAKEKAKAEKHTKIRKNLKVAIKQRDRHKLKPAVSEFKSAKLADVDKDLPKAEKLLNLFNTKDNLKSAMDRRELKDLEGVIDYIKKNSFEVHLPHEMIEANKMLLRLRRLDRLRHEILNLKQSTVAEIRSYQNPPHAVHQVMIATYLLLGIPEKETKVWKSMQALVGKTGKENLKRRVLECDPTKVSVQMAKRAKTLLDDFDLDQVRDVSAGAATFYVWATATIDEVEDIKERKEKGEEVVSVTSSTKAKSGGVTLKSGGVTLKM